VLQVSGDGREASVVDDPVVRSSRPV